MEKFDGLIFGAGYAPGGTRAMFGVDAEGLSLNDGGTAPRWRDITLAKSGWDGTHLRPEWKSEAGTYALSVDDAAAVQALLPPGFSVETSAESVTSVGTTQASDSLFNPGGPGERARPRRWVLALARHQPAG